eukprot:CAMPEP_0174886018 /NCGR_PEP_ID=MMETSP0167-20121228/1287_1 /TAXON_ID=38298 /ORGANISM="Rhodella maculata, Strain CCMP736" /LENGTH=39 /DNA_ID= /DNA_START= /DNA_END= /DNA_ORIENTATION=
MTSRQLVAEAGDYSSFRLKTIKTNVANAVNFGNEPSRNG